jgi:integrase
MRRKQHFCQIGDYWLSKREGSDNWCRTFYERTPGGGRQTRRFSIGTSDPAEASRRLADWYAHNVTLRRAAPQDARLPDVVMRYWEEHSASVRSHDSQTIQIRKCLTLIGDIAVSEFTPATQRKLRADLRAIGHRPAGVNRYVGCINAALRWAINEEHITAHPHIIPNDPVPESETRSMTIEELAALWDAAEEPYLQAFLMTLMCTLCRHEAAVDLRCFQCDLRRGTIRLNPEGRVQTKKRRPLILMPDVFRPWVEVAGVYIVEKRGRPLRSCIIPFRRARDRAKLDKDVSPKVIRTTMNSLMGVRGVSDFVRGAFMGHRGENSTAARHYDRPRIEFLRDGRDAIDHIVSEMGRIAVRPISPETQNVRANCVLAI